MARITRISPADRLNYESDFSTTFRKQLFYGLANLIIMPAYVVMILHCIRLFGEWMTFRAKDIDLLTVEQIRPFLLFFMSLMPHLVLILGMVPLVLSLLSVNRPYWKTGFTHRALLLLMSIFLTTYLLLFNNGPDSEIEKKVFYVVFLTIAFGMIFLITTLVPNWQGILLFLLSWCAFIPSLYYSLNITTDAPLLFFWGLILAVVVIDFFAALLYLRNFVTLREWKNKLEPRLGLNKSKVAALVLFASILFILWLRTNNTYPPGTSEILLAALLPLTLLASAHPRLFFSRQITYLRQVLSPLRHDKLRMLASPTLEESVFLNRLRRWMSQRFRLDNQAFGVPLAFVLGGIAIPLLQVVLAFAATPPRSVSVATQSPIIQAPVVNIFVGTLQPTDANAVLTVTTPAPVTIAAVPGATPASPDTTPTRFPDIRLIDLMALGLPSGLAFGLFYMVYWAIAHRQKYIVLPLSVRGTQEEQAQLNGIASQLMHALTEEIRQIGVLMQLRQVDNTQSSGGSALAHFVASGQEPEFVTQLQSLASLDETRRNSLLGWLLVWITNALALIKVRGTLRKRADNSLELWVELNRRRDQVVAVDRAIVISVASGDFDEAVLHRVAREMAIKLVLKLGQNYHLASSWQSLEYFLDGLKAATERNWWVAIESYRAAIQNEESQRDTFGIGHYHLGAALLSVGEMQEALKHLEQAEGSGPPIAETYYTLALAQANEHWTRLSEEKIIFKQMEERCKLALRLRPNFAEAYHLLGSLYYQRGKAIERASTSRYDVKENQGDRGHWEAQYRKALSYLRKAIRDYDRELELLIKDKDASNGMHLELRRVLEARMIATHLMGDALRSLDYYWEADSYYEDVLTVYPDNLRTLIDRTQNYCLAGQWQRADEFSSRNLMSVPDAQWNADANMYTGWALVGGIRDKLMHTLDKQRFLEGILKRLPVLKKGLPMLKFFFSDKDILEEHFAKATYHLDYAIHQRPRFLTRRLQTDWLYSYVQAAHQLGATTFSKPINISSGTAWTPRLQTTDLQNLYGKDVTKGPLFVDQLCLWLSWRMDNLDYENPQDIMANIRPRPLPEDANLWPVTSEAFIKAYCQFKEHKNVFSVLLKTIKQSGRLHGMSHSWERLRLAASALDNWKIAKQAFVASGVMTLPLNETPMTLGTRWMFLTLNEMSVFTARILMEAWAFETAWQVAARSADDMGLWFHHFWVEPEIAHQNDPAYTKLFRVTPLVYRYNLASLYAIKAYCAIQMKEDPETISRLRAYKQPFNQTSQQAAQDRSVPDYSEYDGLAERALARAQHDVSEALRLIPRHHLAMFVQASLYRQQGLDGEAANELYRLLQTLSSYDPVDYIGNWRTIQKPNLDQMAKLPEIISSLEKHYSSYGAFLGDVGDVETVGNVRDSVPTASSTRLIKELWSKKRQEYAELDTTWKKIFSRAVKPGFSSETPFHSDWSQVKYIYNNLSSDTITLLELLTAVDAPERIEAEKANDWPLLRQLLVSLYQLTDIFTAAGQDIGPRLSPSMSQRVSQFLNPLPKSPTTSERATLLDLITRYDTYEETPSQNRPSAFERFCQFVMSFKRTSRPSAEWNALLNFMGRLTPLFELVTSTDISEGLKKENAANSPIFRHLSSSLIDLQIILSESVLWQRRYCYTLPLDIDAPAYWQELWLVLQMHDTNRNLGEMRQHLRDRMSQQGLVAGQDQFVNFVNRAVIHKELADILFTKPEKQILSIGHLTQAITWTVHRDIEADYLIAHAERLDFLDRFRDAKAVLAALRNIRYFLEPQTETALDSHLGRFRCGYSFFRGN